MSELNIFFQEDKIDSKKKKERKKKNKASEEADELQEEMASLPRPSVLGLWPFRLPGFLYWCVCTFPIMVREHIAERQRQKLLEEEEEEEEEEGENGEIVKGIDVFGCERKGVREVCMKIHFEKQYVYSLAIETIKVDTCLSICLSVSVCFPFTFSVSTSQPIKQQKKRRKKRQERWLLKQKKSCQLFMSPFFFLGNIIWGVSLMRFLYMHSFSYHKGNQLFLWR